MATIRCGPALFAGLVFIFACGQEPEEAPRKVSSPTPAGSQPSGRVAGVATEACPATGYWAVCSVEKRLKQSGFVAQRTDSVGVLRPAMRVKPIAYKLNKSRLDIYLYDDAASAQRAIATIDTVAIAPVFIRSQNLVALLFTDDGTQAERLSLALTAGAPQK